MSKLWLQFACYFGLLGISLGLQLVRPDLFAMLCIQLPISEFLNQGERLDIPLNSPILPHAERIK
jgi:hypothetical protein